MISKNDYQEVWRGAEAYLRARKNDIHVPLSYHSAQQLLYHYPKAQPEVVLLAILLHDIGWAVIDEEEIFSKGFGPNMMESEVRRRHEIEGAKMARELLTGLHYDAALIEEVGIIIDGHDTRPEALSLNDQLVKDADKLWRFTVAGIAVACDWFKLTPGRYAARIEVEIIPQLFTEAAHQMAYEALAEAKRLLKLNVL